MPLIQRRYCEIRDSIQLGDVIAFSGEGLISELIRLITGSQEVSHVGVVLPANLSINGEPQADCFHLVAEANASEVRIISLRSLLNQYKGKLWWLPLSSESRQRLQPNLNCFYGFLLSSNGSKYDYKSVIIEGLRELIAERNLFLRLGRWFWDRLRGNDNRQSFAELLIADSELENIGEPEDIRSQLVDWFIENSDLPEINNPEDVQKYFCSELVTHALQLGGVFAEVDQIDPETVNPLELCQFALYRSDYVLLQPDDLDQSDDPDQSNEGLPQIEGFNTIDPSQWHQ